MTGLKRARRILPGAEVALAFAAATASFALVGATVSAADYDVLAVLLGAGYIVAVVALSRFWGVAYAVPAAMAGVLAYDWFYFPPTHPLEFPDSPNLGYLLGYLVVAVLVGQLAAQAGRRADVSEVARTELVEEQAALRRVATLVAQGVPQGELFDAVTREVGGLLEVDGACVVRYEGDDETVQLGSWNAPGYPAPPPGRHKLGVTTAASEVRRTGRTIRIDDYASINRELPEPVRSMGLRSGVGAPIVVDGRLWGAMLSWSVRPEPLPDTTEARLTDFTELVATAISKSASREELARLADEQAALRRVATLVAREAPPDEVFAAVAREVGQLLGVDATHLGRYDADAMAATGAGSWSADGSHMPVGARSAIEGNNVMALVSRTGRPARMDSYDDASGSGGELARDLGVRSAVGTPIVVHGRLWGVMVASSSKEEPLPPDTESRLAAFTELVATAISNTEARAEVARLAEEQTALRRVATIVAREAAPADVFAAVTDEVARLLSIQDTALFRYEDDATATVVADRDSPMPVGTRVSLDGDSVAARVRRTRRPARIDDYADATVSYAAALIKHGIRSAVGFPIEVEGQLWGVLVAASRQAEPMPADAEARMAQFTELVATSIANIEARSELAASRTRIVAAADEERRRVVRDLHDGAQQRLVQAVVTLKLACRALEQRERAAPELVSEALEQAEQATSELRELAHGILPSALTRGGLRTGVEALAARTPVPVEISVPADRLPPAIEATAYFVVAEALTNIAKHAHATHAAVTALIDDDTLEVQVRDDGIGGAQLDGTGLLGLLDRLAAIDGQLYVESPPEGGTVVAATIPLSGQPRATHDEFSRLGQS